MNGNTLMLFGSTNGHKLQKIVFCLWKEDNFLLIFQARAALEFVFLIVCTQAGTHSTCGWNDASMEHRLYKIEVIASKA